MLRCLASLLLVGCTFTDGEPWGRVEGQLQSAFSAADRNLESGFRTTKDYAIEIESLSLDYDAVTLRLRGADAAAFDPANPPEGCTLCHSGHCHCGNDLVDYETLSTQSADGPALIIPLDAALDPTDAQPVDLPCDAGCEVPRGTLAAIELDLDGGSLTFIARDLRDEPRTQPRRFSVQLGPATLAAAVDERFDRDQSGRMFLSLTHALTARLFDSVDWASVPAEDVAALLSANLVEASVLQLKIQR